MYEIDKLSYLRIGVQGENVSTTIEVDMTTWADEFPGASFHVLFKPYNADLPSPMTSEYEEPVLTWVVTSGATQTPGVGYTEIRAINPETGLVKKTRIIPTSVENSITPGESSSVPPAYTSWVNDVLAAAVDAEDAKDAAEDAQEAAEAAQDAAEDAAADAQSFITQDGISVLQLHLDTYPVAKLPGVEIYHNKKCAGYDTETYAPLTFQDATGQDIYVFDIGEMMSDGVTSLAWKDSTAAGGSGQSFIIWKEGTFANNWAGTVADGIRTVDLTASGLTGAEYMLVTFLEGDEGFTFSKDFSDDTIERGVKGWLRPDDMDTDSKAVLTGTPGEIASLKSSMELRGFHYPITLTSGIYLNSNYNGVRTSESTVTISGSEYMKYWWSGWIDVRGVDRLVLNTVTGSGSGYGFRKGSTITSYPGEAGELHEYRINVPKDVESFSFSVCLFGQSKATADKIAGGNFDDIISLQAISSGEFLNAHADAILRASEGYPPYEMLLTGKTLCIGDSLTVGSKPSGSSGYSGLATPYYTRLTGIGNFPDTITASAVSGYSPSDWYDSFSQITDFSSFNNYLIWLGTNHGPTTEPTASFEDEEPGTEAYYYRKIIEDIVAANQDARIFLGTVFKSVDNFAVVNEYIREIAALYPNNVMGVTNFDDGTLYGETKADLHGGSTTNPHFNEGGYFFVASKWLGEIRRIIRERISTF